VKRSLFAAGAALLALLFLAACASAPPAAPTAKAPAVPAEKVYEGAGKSPSMLNARSFAIMDAVRKGVIELIGVGSEKANQEKLGSVLYNTSNPNAYIKKESLETLRKDKVGEDYLFEIRVAVNLRAVENTLKANGLLGGETPAGGAAAAAGAQAATAEGVVQLESAEAEVPEESGPEPTAEEKRFIARYLGQMTYMVYFNDQATEDPFYMKAAVGIANEYLTSNALEAIDLGRWRSSRRTSSACTRRRPASRSP
jgi:hypothetical protein